MKTSMTTTELDLEPRHLLVVEDDAAFARTLVRSFERRGYSVRHATDGSGLGEVLETFSPATRWWT